MFIKYLAVNTFLRIDFSSRLIKEPLEISDKPQRKGHFRGNGHIDGQKDGHFSIFTR